MNTPKTLSVALTLLVITCTFLVARATRAYEPIHPLQPMFSSSAAIFEKGKAYSLLYHEGLGRHWVACKVVDAKDNWVKCEGGFIKDKKIEEKFVGWINTQNVSRVHE